MIIEDDDCKMLKRQLPNNTNLLHKKKKTNETQKLITDITDSLSHAFSLIDTISKQVDQL